MLLKSIRGNPNHLLTLTLRVTDGFEALERREFIADELKKLVRWLRSHYGADVELFMVPELTKKGMPHLHCLIRTEAALDEADIANHWFDQTGAWVVDLRPIWSKVGALNYLKKYLGKGPAEFKGKKRYWSTSGYVIEPELKPQPVPRFLNVFIREPTRFEYLVAQRIGYPEFACDLYSGVATYGLEFAEAPPEVRRRWGREGCRIWQ